LSRVVIFGANGFVGSHLVKLLAQNNALQIIAVYRCAVPIFSTDFSNVTWHQCDLLAVDSIIDILQEGDKVYHCANTISFDAADADRMMDNNVEGTANLVNICLDKKVAKLLFVSSVAAIARGANGECNEQTPWLQDATTSVYGISKYKAELEVWRGAAEGLAVAIVNPSIILGEGSWESGSNAIFKTIYNEFPFYTNGVNGFVDVQDVVKAMIEIMDSDIYNERFILNQGNYSYQELFSSIAKNFGKKAPQKEAKPWMSAIVWRWYAVRKFFTGKKALITKETAATAHSLYTYNNSKLLHFFPQFHYNSFQDSLQRICNYYLEKAKEE
jgi:dihydroflavonol-4-reductase